VEVDPLPEPRRAPSLKDEAANPSRQSLRLTVLRSLGRPGAQAEPSGDVLPSKATASSLPSFDLMPLPCVQGPMIIANQTLCGSTDVHGYCSRAEMRARNAARRFPDSGWRLNMTILPARHARALRDG
jgi:hypothetical protein